MVGSTERCLVQPGPDTLTAELQAVLGTSRAKRLARNHIDQDPPAGAEGRPLGRHRAREMNARRTALDRDRAQADRAEVQARLAQLRDERAGLRGWQRRQRAALEQRIDAAQAAVEHWQTAAEQAAGDHDAASLELAALIEPHTPNETSNSGQDVAGRDRSAIEQDRITLIDPPGWLTATLGGKPAGLVGREAWLRTARDLIAERHAAPPADLSGPRRGNHLDAPTHLAPDSEVGPDLGM